MTTKRQPRRIAAYCRISIDAPDSTSIDKQEAAIREWIDKHAPGADVEWFIEPGVSGSKAIKRPKRDALEARLADFDVLAFHSADRLARSVVDLHRIVNTAGEAGTQIVSVTQPTIDTTTAQGRAFLGLLAVFSALEAETTGERVKASFRPHGPGRNTQGQCRPSRPE